MKTYSWDAHDYEKSSSAQQLWGKELIAKLNLQGHEHVLDLGCGDGKLTVEIVRHIPNGSVTGADSSKQMIELAQTRYPKTNFPNLHFEQLDARTLPFQNGFDFVFSNAALHWVKDHKPVLEGIYRSLRPGGRILLQMGGQGNASKILAVLAEMMESDFWAKYFDGFEFPYGFHGADDYEKWLCEAGLEPVRVALIEKDMVQQGRDGLAGWIRTTWLPYTERVPEPKREAFITEIVDRYLKTHPADTSGQVHVEMVRLEVEARKPKE
ncbi:MAG: methyltransferase domain-containing protein [Chlorobiales bacterium]|nr:methyltransferase domain-containing protein [Chlorobiales bacterium]